MNLQLFGNKKSFDSKKAERWFKERRVKYQYIDLLRYGMSPGEMRSVCQRLGVDALVDTQSRAYEELAFAYRTPADQDALLLDYPELLRAPILRNGKDATVGFCPETWEQWLKADKG